MPGYRKGQRAAKVFARMEPNLFGRGIAVRGILYFCVFEMLSGISCHIASGGFGCFVLCPVFSDEA